MDRGELPAPLRGAAAVVGRAGMFARDSRTRARSAVAARRHGSVPGLLSLIVPVYNVEEYLDECLTSLRGQSYPHVEIVVVDDGSPDRSVRIARHHRLKDPRIRIVHRPNGGLSAARNTGVRASRGEFIAFADSDDTVPPDGYRAAVESLLESGSDFSVSPYQRLKGGLVTPAATWIRDAHVRRRTGITVDDYPGIQVNAIMCSKVFRRDFWLEKDLAFVEGIIYEDQQVSAEAYTRARAFDVLTQPIYNWRARMDRTSISQNKKEARNLRAQFAAARASVDVLRKHGSARVVEERLVQLLSNDMGLFSGLVVGADDEFWEALKDELPPLVDQLDPGHYVRAIPAQQKVLYHLIATGQRAAAERLVRSGGLTLRTTRLGEEEVGHVAYLTSWDDPEADVPQRFYVLSDGQTRPRTSVRDVRILAPARVEVTAWAFLQNVDLSVQDQTVRATAVCPGHDPVELGVEQLTDPAIDEIGGVSGSGYCDYRPGGVRLGVDLTALAPGTWEVELEISSGSVRRTATLRQPWNAGTAAVRHAALVAPGRTAALGCRERRLEIRVYDDAPVAEEVRYAEGRLRLSGSGPVPRTLVATRRSGRPVRATPRVQGDRWSAELDLTGQHEKGPAGTVTQWSFTATVDGHPDDDLPVRFGPDRSTVAVETDDDAAGALRWRALPGHLDQLLVRTWQGGAQVTAARVEDDGVVVEVETFGLDLDRYQPVFESRPRTVPAVVSRDGDRLTCRLPFRESRWGRPDQVIVSAPYSLQLEHRRTGHRVAPKLTPAVVETLPVDVLRDVVRVRLQLRAVDQGQLAVLVSAPLQPDERGIRNQLALQERANAGSGSSRSVFFRTLYGESTNDNGLAVHEELRRRGTDLTLYWAVADHSVPVPEGGVPVLEESRAWHEALGDAGYVVVNVHQPMWYRKPEDQVMVETFHGYPYKGMGQDWWERSGLPTSRISSFVERAADWDYLVSPAGYATPLLLDAFFAPDAAERVTVLEVGYPRNDVLLRPEGEQARRRTREALGIRPEQKAVLYAPTFRDYLSHDGMTARVGDFFDPEVAAKALGPDYVVLQRGHAFHARANEARVDAPGVVDVTYYPDIAELCLASDAAILDYSSLRFDYALTRRPMVFLVPDKQLYHSLRPAVVDFDPTAPGPHVDTTEQAVAQLRRLDALAESYGPAVETFIATHMEHEDGHAAARVVDAVFERTDPGAP